MGIERTEQERAVITKAYSKLNHDESLDPDEVRALLSFEADRVRVEAELQTKLDDIRKADEAQLQVSLEQQRIATETLEALRDKALAELEKVNDEPKE